MHTPAFLSVLLLVCTTATAFAQSGEGRPPIASPGGTLPPTVTLAPTQDGIARMDNALRQAGCSVNLTNRAMVLERFGGDAAEARAVLNSMKTSGLVVINEQRGAARLRDCAPVPMAGPEADLLG